MYSGTTQLSVYGGTIQLSVYGGTTQLSVYGGTTQLSVYGGTTQLSVYGRTTQLSVYGRTTQLSVYGGTTQLSVYGGTTQLSTYTGSFLTTWWQGPDRCWYVSLVISLYTACDVEKCALCASNEHMMAALSSMGNEVYKVQQKVKTQQLTVMDMWQRRNSLHF